MVTNRLVIVKAASVVRTVTQTVEATFYYSLVEFTMYKSIFS